MEDISNWNPLQELNHIDCTLGVVFLVAASEGTFVDFFTNVCLNYLVPV